MPSIISSSTGKLIPDGGSLVAPPLPPGTQRVSRSAMRSEEEETEGVRSDVSPESYLSTLDDLIDIQFTTEGPESSTEPPEQVEDGMEGFCLFDSHMVDLNLGPSSSEPTPSLGPKVRKPILPQVSEEIMQERFAQVALTAQDILEASKMPWERCFFPHRVIHLSEKEVSSPSIKAKVQRTGRPSMRKRLMMKRRVEQDGVEVEVEGIWAWAAVVGD
ncbi:MAG: hypothetical protein DHS80DRAFT_29054 [Piptocephalis tieghemiana]|nr:MAG: hypothetical protein DHS80DRAFT_29054 [Piptocephalis tieghemiana]